MLFHSRVRKQKTAKAVFCFMAQFNLSARHLTSRISYSTDMFLSIILTRIIIVSDATKAAQPHSCAAFVANEYRWRESNPREDT
jgi:hypothetical protein